MRKFTRSFIILVFALNLIFIKSIGQLPAKVILSQPANNSSAINAFNFSWHPDSLVYDFFIQVATDSLFSNPIKDSAITGPELPLSMLGTPLIPTKHYYWKVAAKNANGTGPYSDVWKFVYDTITILPAPLLNSPANGDTGLSFTQYLMWNNISNASIYQLQVSPDSTFKNVRIMVVNAMINTTGYNINQGVLKPSTTYYWRVLYKNAASQVSPFSQIWNFTTIDGKVSAPILSFPSNGMPQTSLITSLEWSFVNNALDYFLEIAKDTLFTNTSEVYEQQYPYAGISMPRDYLNINTTYYWRVTAEGPADSVRSVIWNFTTDSVGIAPAYPNIVYPTINTTIPVPVNLTFKWNTSKVATSYNLMLYYSNMDTLLIDTTINAPDTTFQIKTSLKYDTSYMYELSALNQWGSSEPIEGMFFTELIPGTVPKVPMLNFPSNYYSGESINYINYAWSPENGANYYKINIKDSSGYNFSDTTSLNYYISKNPLKYLHFYQWSVQACNSSGCSNYSLPWTFQTDLPYGPTLISPANGATFKTTTPTLMWDSVAGINKYLVEVANNNQFIGDILSDTVYGDSYTVPGGYLNDSMQCYWRVSSMLGMTTGYIGSPFSFNIQQNGPAPDSIILYSPYDMEKIQNQPDVEFYWVFPTITSTYRIKIAKDTLMQHIVLFDSTSSNNLSYQLPINKLQPYTKYFFQIVAVDDYGMSSTKVLRFLVGDTASASPYTPVLIGPNGISSPMIRLNWNPLMGAQILKVMVSTDKTFTNTSAFVVDSVLFSTDSIYYGVKPLKIGVTYYWTVGGKMSTMPYSFAKPFSFIVDTSGILPQFTIMIAGVNNDSAIFTNTTIATTSNVSWYWDFGDGTVAGAKNTSHKYLKDGSYNVCLSAKTATGSVRQNCMSLIIGSGVSTANFSFNIQSNDTVIFVNQTTGMGLHTWYWDFGDGSYSTVKNPFHVFNPGVYNVCLSVKDSTGFMTQYCSNVPIGGNTCVANYVYYINATNDTVFFNDRSTGNINKWFWDFGNGMTSTQQNVALKVTPKVYNVMLSVFGGNGCNTSVEKSVMINGSVCDNISDFSFYVNPLTYEVTFTNTSQGNNMTYYNWNFGDGHISLAPDPVYSYADSGLYTVTLTISDSTRTCVSTTNKAVEIGLINCSAAFTYFSDSTLVSFNNTSIGASTNMNWIFGDGAQSSLMNPSHRYPAQGYYTVELYTYASGTKCMDYNQQTILAGKIGKDCQAGFNYFSNLNTDSSISFMSQSIGNNITGYIWNFGDGKLSTTPNPTHHYTDSGYYSVCLTISERSTGCVNSICKMLKVGNTDQDCYIKYMYSVDTATRKVLFKDNSIGGPISFQWYFGTTNNDSSHLENPSFTYPANGFYPVHLIAITPSGCRGEYLQLISINGGDSLKGTFMTKAQSNLVDLLKINEGPFSQSISNLEDNRMKSVSFAGAAYGDPSSFLWDFGDGTFDSTTLDPTHVYASYGTYEACLTVNDLITGQQDTYCNQITIDSTSAATAVNPLSSDQFILNMYPDPMSRYLNIQYSLPENTKVTVSIYDELGSLVSTIVSQDQNSGTYNITWQNPGIANGIYYLKLSTANVSITKKVIVIN